MAQNHGDDVNETIVWALYSRNVATFWDPQVGIRQDEPDSTTYAVLGVSGLARAR